MTTPQWDAASLRGRPNQPTNDVPYWHYVCSACSKPVEVTRAWYDEHSKTQRHMNCLPADTLAALNGDRI